MQRANRSPAIKQSILCVVALCRCCTDVNYNSTNAQTLHKRLAYKSSAGRRGCLDIVKPFPPLSSPLCSYKPQKISPKFELLCCCPNTISTSSSSLT